MKIFGKTLKEYIWPIWYYVVGAVLVVPLQYYVAVPLADRFPFILNLTQALWALMVAFFGCFIFYYYPWIKSVCL